MLWAILMLTLEEIKKAEDRISTFVLKTPLVYSDFLSRFSGKNVYLKLETQQYTSSFKPRPAFNNILGRLEETKKRGVIASSSGNFAQAVAYAAQKLGVSAQIVMTKSASPYKKERTRSFGAEIIESGDSFEERQATLKNLQKESGRILLHQYDTFETMAGDATVATEVLRQFSEDFAILSPTSGGGLSASVSFATKESRPQCEVYGILPHSHQWPVEKPKDVSENTIADALVPGRAGTRTYPLIQKYVDDLVFVTNDEIKKALRALAFEQRLIVEPGGAVPVAALLAQKLPKIRSKNVICILTGGNIEFGQFVEYLRD
jgi:threonine dehydratase